MIPTILLVPVGLSLFPNSISPTRHPRNPARLPMGTTTAAMMDGRHEERLLSSDAAPQAVSRSLQSSAKKPDSRSFSNSHEVMVPAVQLAESVRLPASVLAQADTRLEQPPEVMLAKQRITDGFYQEIAIKAAASGAAAAVLTPGEAASGQSEEPGISDPETETVVIPPGTDVDEARINADEIYHVLFGDAAYNQHNLGSFIEVQLPADP